MRSGTVGRGIRPRRSARRCIELWVLTWTLGFLSVNWLLSPAASFGKRSKMDMQFAVSVVFTSVGAFFVWMVGIARKDPPLYRELRRFVLTAIISAEIFFISLAVIVLCTDWLPSPLRRPVTQLILLVTASTAVFACVLPALTRISKLPPLTKTPPTQSETPPAPPDRAETKQTSAPTTSSQEGSV